MAKAAAIYARVSSDRQKENHTIASQLAALIEYAETHGYAVPSEWCFQDEGFSGATLLRPGLEALRDLAAAGHLEVVLVYSPDRLSRKYAYQVLLAEELSRCGVELVFLKAPSGATPEDHLLVQFQGMIAEYERAQIAERSRRGKRHRARQGSINVLSGAPYGYRYVKKSDASAAYYEIIESEAAVVRLVYETYTRQGLSINAIARLLNERHISTRTATTRWERSTVWGMLRNPAYRGRACFGKTELRPRRRITRPLRQRPKLASRDSANHERPRQDWIEITVPALISEETFALAQEQLEQNHRHSPRRTIEPSLLQGMLVCERCGYALYRTSTRTSARKLYYYRCLGSDAYRHLKGAVCDNRPVRQDHLDAVVWKELLRLLEDPRVIQGELNRRREAARRADPLKQRDELLRRDQARLEKSMDRLLNAYQEGLVSLEQLRGRMPELRQHQHAVQTQLQSLEAAATDDAQCLRLVETLGDFHARLRERADTLEVTERQKILRLLVKEVLVGQHNVTIRHSAIRSAYRGLGPTLANGSTPLTHLSNLRRPNPVHIIFCVQAVISPLLSNIYLDALDQEMAAQGIEMVRYADDFVVLCGTAEEAQQALAQVQQWTAAAGLTLHPGKTRIVDATREGGFDFLGYHFERGMKWPRRKSERKFRDTIRAQTRRTAGRSLEATIVDLNRTLGGWFAYFQHSHKTTFPTLEGWVRMRLRSILRRWRGGQGPGRGADHQRWPNAYFAERGLFCLVTAHAAACQSSRR